MRIAGDGCDARRTTDVCPVAVVVRAVLLYLTLGPATNDAVEQQVRPPRILDVQFNQEKGLLLYECISKFGVMLGNSPL
jgi:hypothetical protein